MMELSNYSVSRHRNVYGECVERDTKFNKSASWLADMDGAVPPPFLTEFCGVTKCSSGVSEIIFRRKAVPARFVQNGSQRPDFIALNRYRELRR
ncbi:unnamed protein product [Toxocara canis]|uniref:Transposase n=1 Tax=Toxocara canis TaxID=6265 RepID=A0A183VCI7_TOXCA|nr:unnamed protein product [Toxocara canis]